jgi:hypothetical protein
MVAYFNPKVLMQKILEEKTHYLRFIKPGLLKNKGKKPANMIMLKLQLLDKAYGTNFYYKFHQYVNFNTTARLRTESGAG